MNNIHTDMGNAIVQRLKRMAEQHPTGSTTAAVTQEQIREVIFHVESLMDYTKDMENSLHQIATLMKLEIGWGKTTDDLIKAVRVLTVRPTVPENMVPVNTMALMRVLQALNGPAHVLREMQVIRGMHPALRDQDSPIDIVLTDYNNWVTNNTSKEEEIADDHHA